MSLLQILEQTRSVWQLYPKRTTLALAKNIIPTAVVSLEQFVLRQCSRLRLLEALVAGRWPLKVNELHLLSMIYF
jgi:hypothetical protein